MTILDEDVMVMNQAGLTIMEAKIYLSLLNFNMASIKDIAKEAEIDRSNCYRTILLLQDLGLVTMIIGRPNLYVGTPFKKGVQFLLEQQKKKYEEVKKATTKLANRLEKESVKDELLRGETFSIIPKKTRFINRAVKGIVSSQKSIKCISSFKRYSQALNYSFDSIKSSLNRGVYHHSIINKPETGQKIPQTLKTLMEYPNFEIRYLPNIPEALGSCVDNKRIGILLEPDQNVKESDMLSSVHPSLVAIFNEYFKNLWNEAKDLKNLKQMQTE
ncbi:MAG: TrmB family transcriptional regulator [archaeon]